MLLDFMPVRSNSTASALGVLPHLQEWSIQVEACLSSSTAASQQMTPDARCALLYSLYVDIGGQLPDACLHQVMRPLVPGGIEACRCVSVCLCVRACVICPEISTSLLARQSWSGHLSKCCLPPAANNPRTVPAWTLTLAGVRPHRRSAAAVTCAL
eukprot:scaffold100049_cov17-Tisochrysis_lutea.AAC.1